MNAATPTFAERTSIAIEAPNPCESKCISSLEIRTHRGFELAESRTSSKVFPPGHVFHLFENTPHCSRDDLRALSPVYGTQSDHAGQLITRSSASVPPLVDRVVDGAKINGVEHPEDSGNSCPPTRIGEA